MILLLLAWSVVICATPGLVDRSFAGLQPLELHAGSAPGLQADSRFDRRLVQHAMAEAQPCRQHVDRSVMARDGYDTPPAHAFAAAYHPETDAQGSPGPRGATGFVTCD